ncbi:MAG: hypothetical protein MI974_31095 [Chitinophagales bacterium]|nr:hypothetical protein [Chitinophagales bacterium]
MESKDLNIKELISKYVLGHLNFDKLTYLAVVALQNNYDSESMRIVAGMNLDDNTFEKKEYFEKALVELRLTFTNKIDSANIIFNYYINKILDNRLNCYGGINMIIK